MKCIAFCTSRTARLAAIELAAIVTIFAAQHAQAGDADVLRHYRFLSTQSSLEQHWIGLEPPDVIHPVFGTFDVLFTEESSDPWLGRSARFMNVQAYAENPLTATPLIFLNDVLNLEELQGHQLPVAAPFDVYQFTGKTKDGSSVSLFSDILGDWFTLNGGTTLPDGQKFGVEYSIHALAHERPFADFNDDAVVDQLDLEMFQAHFGQPMASDSAALTDANGDSAMNGFDFFVWQHQAGEHPPTLSGAINAAPEPSAAALALAAAALLLARKRN
jgi:hypothetical protein